jgi:hypothetical protein
MTRTLLLATAMLLIPLHALASSTSNDRAKTLGPIARITPPCTAVNPCAVPTPALGTLPTLFQLERQTRNEVMPASKRREARDGKL